MEQECEVCGKLYRVFASVMDKQRNCSKACSHKWRAKVNAGKGNPNWRGGTSSEPYPFDWKAVRLSVIERDGGACRNDECYGRTSKINVHHIDHNKKNLSPINLITLCVSCNARANFKREYWKAKYLAITAHADSQPTHGTTKESEGEG